MTTRVKIYVNRCACGRIRLDKVDDALEADGETIVESTERLWSEYAATARRLREAERAILERAR